MALVRLCRTGVFDDQSERGLKQIFLSVTETLILLLLNFHLCCTMMTPIPELNRGLLISAHKLIKITKASHKNEKQYGMQYKCSESVNKMSLYFIF